MLGIIVIKPPTHLVVGFVAPSKVSPTILLCYSLATHEMVVAAVLLGQQWAHHTSYFISYLPSPQQQHTHAQYLKTLFGYD